MPLSVMHVSRWSDARAGGGVSSYLDVLKESLITIEHLDLQFDALLDSKESFEAYRSQRFRTGRQYKAIKACQLLFRLVFPKKKYDIIHIHGVTDIHFIICLLASLISRKPLVCSPHGALSLPAIDIARKSSVMNRIYFDFMVSPLLKGVRSFVVSSGLELDSVKRLSIAAKPYLVAPAVKPASQLATEVDDKLSSGGSSDSNYFIFIGRLEPIKSIPLMFSAISRLKAKGEEVLLYIVGEGESSYTTQLKNLSKLAGVDQQISWLGFQAPNRVADLLTRARCLILPSQSENFGYVVAEAILHSCPVIASDQVGAAEIIEADGCGIVFKSEDENALASAIELLINDTVHGDMIIAAEKSALRRFSLQEMAAGLKDVYYASVSNKR
jgi:glycosyltransferase involved in cell wall biosynthesis